MQTFFEGASSKGRDGGFCLNGGRWAREIDVNLSRVLHRNAQVFHRLVWRRNLTLYAAFVAKTGCGDCNHGPISWVVRRGLNLPSRRPSIRGLSFPQGGVLMVPVQNCASTLGNRPGRLRNSGFVKACFGGERHIDFASKRGRALLSSVQAEIHSLDGARAAGRVVHFDQH